MPDHSHLHAIELRLSHERDRLRRATRPDEIAIRTVWVAGYEKELADERRFLGLADDSASRDLTDDELLAELGVKP